MKKQLRVASPSPMLDAHFRQTDTHHKGGAHAGVPYTERRFEAKIVIDPADAPKWAAGLKGVTGYGASMPTTARPAPDWWVTPADLAGVKWYDPTPLFGPCAGGYVGVSDAGVVFVTMRD
jgi:hypothetical protein